MSFLAQLSVYATQSDSKAFSVSTNPGATVAYPSVNLTEDFISVTTGAHEETIRIWKEYANVMRSDKQVIFNHVPDTCYRTLNNKYNGYVNSTYLDI